MAKMVVVDTKTGEEVSKRYSWDKKHLAHRKAEVLNQKYGAVRYGTKVVE